MAGGTKMTLHRYGGSLQDWKEQLIIVDDAYLSSSDGLNVTLKYPYEMGVKGQDVIEVFFNGQRLSRGGGYLEIDDITIQLNLGIDEEGNPILLEPEDEIFIRFYENHYYNHGGNLPSATDITNILKTVEEIINYGGASNLDMTYEYNNEGQIIREVSAGDYDIVREFTWNSIKELETETIYFQERIIQKTYTYDLSNARLTRTSVRVIV